MRKQTRYFLLVVMSLCVSSMFSQKRKNDTINTGVIDIVKPYVPSISDAFKVKDVPLLNDKETTVKKEIKYNIFSFPVASTFTPAKGKAEIIGKTKPIKLYNNYATIGVGSYTTILGDIYLNQTISRTESVGGYLSHHSSQGGIEGVEFDDYFSNTKVNANYSSRLRDLAWNVEGGFEHQIYNWYGIEDAQIEQAKTNKVDVKHLFYNAYLSGDITFHNTYINSGSLLLRRFGDDQSSSENRIIAKTKIDIPVREEEISTEFKFDYIDGDFKRKYNVEEQLRHRNFQMGIAPSYQLKRDDLTVNLGVSLVYMNNLEQKENKFYIYPNITASYRLASDVLIAYGGVQGDLIQNSYYDFAAENPFVSPTLLVAPTDQKYNGFIGLKGKLSSNMSYNIGGRYLLEERKALYKNNAITLTSENYTYGNSFGMVYDNVETFSAKGEINLDVSRNFKLAIKAEYFKYITDLETEAWNLPELKGSLFLDYQINNHWFTGVNLFYVGDRKDLFVLNDGINLSVPKTVVLDSYFDANAHLGYHVNDKISIYAKANNINNKAYQRWQNYPVQSIQFLAGATFKFNF